MRSYSFRLRESGSIIVVSLWILIILTILSAALGNFILGQIKFSDRLSRTMLSVPLAAAACRDGLQELCSDEERGFNTQRDFSRERKRILSAGSGYQFYFEDELSRINVNTAPPEVLSGLPGMNEDLARTIAGSPRRPFKVKEELLLVEGMTKEKFNAFKDMITVYGNGKININTASASVLMCLGLDEDCVAAILRYRAESLGPDDKKDTDDDGAFTDAGLVLTQLNKFDSFLSLRQQQTLLELNDIWAVASNNVTIKVSALVRGKQGNRYSITLDTEKKKIVCWKE